MMFLALLLRLLKLTLSMFQVLLTRVVILDGHGLAHFVLPFERRVVAQFGDENELDSAEASTLVAHVLQQVLVIILIF